MSLFMRSSTPINRDSVADQIYRTLRKAILNGEFEDGERFVQHVIAERMGTSRIPVRDALKRLEADGLLAKGPHGSYYCKRFGAADLQEVYTLRSLLEPLALTLAMDKLDDEALNYLGELLEAMEDAIEAGDAERYVDLNRDFHWTIYERCEQPRLIQMIKSLWLGRPLFIAGDLGSSKSAREHQAILQALKAGKAAEVEQLLRDHILGSLQVLMRRMNSRSAT